MMVIDLYLGPVAVTKKYGEALGYATHSIKHAGIKRYERTRVQTVNIRKSRLQYDLIKTEEPRYRIEEMPRSLVAALLRGGRLVRDLI